ncbi:hypothetical protein PV10_01714 [Exophiala mesophila]|uniref:Zn(2)-C6 fungal-type domain-containing protein n=1 Tax=Exophiala mesophila TaxID=212818 RepID=A0A0D1YBN8_EXOME|nr:uncharacterized protein PV10_01714 [Exophiala mesophila]KIV98021.1 hypothetical protein PV10_01714 [Exophiala mesophila]
MANPRAVPNSPRACSYCRIRKVKCDGSVRCSNCVTHEKECYYPPSQRGKHNKTRLRSNLEDRLSRMEALINTTALERSSKTSVQVTDTNQSPGTSKIHQQTPNLTSMSPPRFTPQNLMTFDPSTVEESVTVDAQPAPVLETSWEMEPVAPILTPTTWTAAPGTISSAFSVDEHNLGETEHSDDAHQEDCSFPSQTRIWEHHGPGSWLSLCSEPGVAWVRERTGGADFGSTAAKLTPAWNRRWKFGGLANRSRSEEPTAEIAWKYTAAYFDHCFEAVFGVVYRPEFEARLHAHFQNSAPSSTDDVAWYALRNTVYAAGCRQILLKDDITSYADAQAEASRYFENALSVHTDLIYGPSGLEAIRALVAMTFYAESAANEGFEYMMCANAVRLAQAKGLHRQPSRSLNLPENEVLHLNWLFWAIFCLEKQIAFRSGRPSAIDDDNVSCELPNHAPPGSTIDVPFFRHAVGMGKVATQLAHRLCSVTALRQSPLAFIEAANDIGQQIEVWRQSLGQDFQTPGKAINVKSLRPNMKALHVIYLQFMYYSAIQSAYAIFSFPWVASILGIEKSQTFQEEAAIKSLKVADAARNNILIAKAMDLDAALPQWASFYFPMAGLTNLFVFLLSRPTLPSAQADVVLLDVAAGQFSHMAYLTSSEKGSGFTREICQLARNAVERSRRKLRDGVLSPQLTNTGDWRPEETMLPRPEPFDADHFDLEGWNVYSTVLIDGMLTDEDLWQFPAE